MMFGTHFNDVSLKIGDSELKCTKTEKHIGHIISSEGDLINFKQTIRKIAEKTNCVSRNFRSLNSECKSKLFTSQCCSLFGIELMDLSSTQMAELELQWRKSVRHLMNLHPRTHNNLLAHIMGMSSIASIVHSRIICFIKRGLENKNVLIAYFFRNSMLNLHSYLSRNMYIILGKLNLVYTDLRSKSENWLKRACKSEPEMDWKAKMVKELVQCRDGTIECPLNLNEINMILTHLCIE